MSLRLSLVSGRLKLSWLNWFCVRVNNFGRNVRYSLSRRLLRLRLEKKMLWCRISFYISNLIVLLFRLLFFSRIVWIVLVMFLLV